MAIYLDGKTYDEDTLLVSGTLRNVSGHDHVSYRTIVLMTYLNSQELVLSTIGS
jgi:hypothetical protein